MIFQNLSSYCWRRFSKSGINFVSYGEKSYVHSSLTHQRPSGKQQQWIPHSFKNSDNLKLKDARIKEKEKNLAYIALGSNMGNRVQWIEEACNRMSKRGIKFKRTSSLWETKPMYYLEQELFLNGICEVETDFQPLELLDLLQDIEKELGRKKVIDKGPRNIDLDILLYNDETFNHERLQIPHPGILDREFVLRPLSELIPGKSLNKSSPWKITQDYLNSIPLSALTTVTPIANGVEPIYSMKTNRQTHIMAILNITPDSFSDGRKYPQPLSYKDTYDIIDKFLDGGASIIDIGGQSSRPFAENISTEEEITRILPAIEHARRYKRDNLSNKSFVISVDTYRAKVAEAAVQSGADIINDVSAGTLDPDMLPTMARLEKTVCLTHMRGTPGTMNELTDYPEGLISTIARELMERIKAAEAAGIRRWRIILDPGIGFAKKLDQNLEILRYFDELRTWPGLQGFPWLVGSSRKKFIGNITGVEVPRERIWGTSATIAAAIMGGADIVRVHDVEEMAKVAKMSDAIWRS